MDKSLNRHCCFPRRHILFHLRLMAPGPPPSHNHNLFIFHTDHSPPDRGRSRSNTHDRWNPNPRPNSMDRRRCNCLAGLPGCWTDPRLQVLGIPWNPYCCLDSVDVWLGSGQEFIPATFERQPETEPEVGVHCCPDFRFDDGWWGGEGLWTSKWFLARDGAEGCNHGIMAFLAWDPAIRGEGSCMRMAKKKILIGRRVCKRGGIYG